VTLRHSHVPPRIGPSRRAKVLDFIFIAIGIGFFAASCLYLYACDRL
jgi:hypothetical protein